MKNFFKLKIIKRVSSFILLVSLVSVLLYSNYNIAFCAEVGAIESVAVTVGTLYSAVQSGQTVPVVSDFFKKAVVFSSEIRNNYFMPPDSVDTFYDQYMISLGEKIQSGDLIEAQIGNVKYIGGHPVSFDCPTLGCYAFFCNQAIADRIDAYVGQKNISVVASIVDGYWDQEFYRVRRPDFNIMVSDIDNWRCCFDITGSDAVSIQAFWDTFGLSLQDPDMEFYQTGVWAHCFTSNWYYDLAIGTQYAVQGNEYLVLKCPDYQASTAPAYPFGVSLFYYDPSWGDFKYRQLTQFYSFYGRENVSAQAVNNLQSLTISKSRLDEIMYYDSGFCINMDDLFPESALDIIEGANTGVLNPADEWWNTKDWEDVVDLIGDAVAEAVDAGVTDVPLDIPDVVTADDLPVTDWADDDFVDTTGVIAVDDDTPFPDVPVDPSPEDPEDPQRPELILPVLGSLFPFCIPVDIYNTFRVLNTTVAEPIWDIPLNVSIQGRVLTNTTLHIDLTSNGLDALFTSLRVVQILVFIVGLGMFTKRFIF